MSGNQSYHVFQIPVHLIKPNPSQPRKVFDEDMLNELAASIEQYGIMQPISIRKIMTNYYEIVAGERRLRAVKKLGHETIPAIIVNVTEKDSAVLALVENLQRENLNYIEEARGYQHLISDFDLKQQDLADQLGKGQSTIANKLRLLQLSDDVQQCLLDSTLSERHARALLKLPDNAVQLEVVKKMIADKLTVSQSEKMIQKLLSSNDEKLKTKDKGTVKRYLKDIRLFTNTIKQAVDMVKTSGVNVDYRMQQTEESYEISISIPIED